MQIWVEDNKSGYVFWNHVNRLLFNKRFKVVKGNGNRDVRNRMRITNSNEIIVIIVDRMLDNSITRETYKQILGEYQNNSNMGIALYGSTERSFLTFKNLDFYIRNNRGLEYLKHIRDLVITHSNICGSIIFNDIKDKYFMKFCNDNVRPDKYGNICSETVYSALLSSITNSTNAKITKDKIGPCWILDCCNISDKTCSLKDKEKLLGQNDRELQNKPAIVKLLELIVSSEFGITISEIINFVNLYTRVRYHGEQYDIRWKNEVLNRLKPETRAIDIIYLADKYMVERNIDSWNYEKIYRRFLK